jgi:phage-related minor tail protein
MKKLKLQKNLSKQFKRETSEYNKLKQKREKIDLEIKNNTKKIKEKEKVIKKQIDEKTKKLHNIKQKNSLKSAKKSKELPKRGKTKK